MVVTKDCGACAKLQLRAEPLTEASTVPARCRRDPAPLACDRVSISIGLISSAGIFQFKLARFLSGTV